MRRETERLPAGFAFDCAAGRFADAVVERTGRDRTGPERIVHSDKKINQ
jgi:hypothetical protein